MLKLLKAMIGIFLVVGIVGCIIMMVIPKTPVPAQEEVQTAEEEYPTDIRPIEDTSDETAAAGETPEETIDETIEENIEETTEEEILPEEDFKEFEIEEEAVTEEKQEEEIPVEEPAPAVQTPITVSEDKVNIRESASGKAKIAGVALRGQVGNLVEPGEKWSYVEFPDGAGYVSTRFIINQADQPEPFQRFVDAYNQAEAKRAAEEAAKEAEEP